MKSDPESYAAIARRRRAKAHRWAGNEAVWERLREALLRGALNSLVKGTRRHRAGVGNELSPTIPVEACFRHPLPRDNMTNYRETPANAVEPVRV